jgi:hypothetical protein
MRLEGHAVVGMEETRKSQELSAGNTQGKRPSGRTLCRWGHNITMDLKEK